MNLNSNSQNSNSQTSLLNVQNVAVGYAGGLFLRVVSLQVEPGQVVCLLGRNGAVKTTLLKTIIGLLRAGNGHIAFAGRDITRAASFERARAGIGYVPQGREVFAQLSVEENLMLGLEAAPKANKTREANGKVAAAPQTSQNGNRKNGNGNDDNNGPAHEVFEMFPMLREMTARKGGTLSGGQQQQLAIGRALIAHPKLLLLDEPMEGIQPSVVQQIEGVIEGLKARRDVGILLVEQSLEFATRIADYFYILDKGTVAAHGQASQLDDELIRRHLTV